MTLFNLENLKNTPTFFKPDNVRIPINKSRV